MLHVASDQFGGEHGVTVKGLASSQRKDKVMVLLQENGVRFVHMFKYYRSI